MALLLFVSCAPSKFEGVLPQLADRSVPRPIEILYTGDMAGKVEPCG
ncbi:MAG: hypothetical protein KDA27_05285 [Candidatus Eisenbacteria bacterium]|uniref:Uncharacterized protein n=1 Tax=Eiseniibacteriota bacterium TaxID=2212470 RepID=A0A956SCB3_UNCEI|nr:hypothetical protein [Candidatus Eisenbacteria bacterium]